MSRRAARHVKAPGGPERVRSAGGLLCLRKKPPISQFPAAWVPACSRRKRTMPVRKVYGVSRPTISIKIKRITKFLKNFNFNATN